MQFATGFQHLFGYFKLKITTFDQLRLLCWVKWLSKVSAGLTWCNCDSFVPIAELCGPIHDAIPICVRLLKDVDTYVRMNAAASLGNMAEQGEFQPYMIEL